METNNTPNDLNTFYNVYEYYKELDIKNFSVEVMRLINNQIVLDLGNSKGKDEGRKILNNIFSDISNLNLSDESNLKDFKKSLEELVNKTNKDISDSNPSIKLDIAFREASQKYKINIVSQNLAPNATKSLDVLSGIFINNNFSKYINAITNSYTLEDKEKLDYIVENRINLLTLKKSNFLNLLNSESFQNEFMKKIDDLNELKLVVSKETKDLNEKIEKTFINYTKTYINKNYANILENKERIENELFKGSKIIKDIRNNEIFIDGKINEKIVNEVTKSFGILGDNIKGKIDSQVTKMVVSLDTVINQTIDVSKALTETQERVLERNKLIKKKIVEIEDVIKNSKDFSKLKKEYGKLLQFQNIDIDILNVYTSKVLDVFTRPTELNKIKEQAEKLYKKFEEFPLFKDKIENSIEKLKNPNNILDICNTLSNGLIDVGLLKGEDAKNVAVLLNYSGVAIDIGASIISGNFVGAVFKGLGMFGGGKPLESPELQYLKQISGKLDQISGKLDGIAKNLEVIDKKIDNLTEITTNMYKDMIKGFQQMQENFDKVNVKLDELKVIALEEKYWDFYNCKRAIEKLKNKVFKENTYASLVYNFNNVAISNCMEGGLNKLGFIDATYGDEDTLLSKMDVEKTSDSDKFKKSGFKDSVYKIIKEFINKKFSNSEKIIALNLALHPASSFADSDKGRLFFGLDNIQYNDNEINNILGDTYYNYEFIINLAETYLKFMPYLQFVRRDGDTYGMLNNLKEYFDIESDPEKQILRKENMIKDLKFLLKSLDCSIIQQSLLSGNVIIPLIYDEIQSCDHYPEGDYKNMKIYMTNVDGKDIPNYQESVRSFNVDRKYKGKEGLEILVKLLNDNQILARNYTTYLYYKDKNYKNSFDKYFEDIGPDETHKEFPFEFPKSYLATNITLKRSKKEIEKGLDPPFLAYFNYGTMFDNDGYMQNNYPFLPIPKKKIILNGEIIYTDALYKLLDVKQKIINKIFELSLTNSIDDKSKFDSNYYKLVLLKYGDY